MRSSRCRNCAGGSSSPARWPIPAASARAIGPVPSAAIASAGRSTVTVRPGAARRHSSTSCSTAPSWRAKANSHVGPQRGVLGERHRVVGVRAVDQRRRHQHDVARGDRGGERGGDPLGGALVAAGPGLGVGRGEPHQHPSQLGRGRHRAGDRSWQLGATTREPSALAASLTHRAPSPGGRYRRAPRRIRPWPSEDDPLGGQPVRQHPAVRRSGQGARRPGSAELGRRPSVRPARLDGGDSRRQRRPGGAHRPGRPGADRRDARARRHRPGPDVPGDHRGHPGHLGAAHARGLPPAVHRAGHLARSAARAAGRRARSDRRSTTSATAATR